MSAKSNMEYGERTPPIPYRSLTYHDPYSAVRLGKSGLKVSRIILGCMQFGNPGWAPWVLGEDAAVEQIKYA